MAVHDLNLYAHQLRQRVYRFQSFTPDYRLRLACEDSIGGFDTLFVDPGRPVMQAVLLRQFVINRGTYGIAQSFSLFQVVRRIVAERTLNNLLVVVQPPRVLIRIRNVIQPFSCAQDSSSHASFLFSISQTP